MQSLIALSTTEAEIIALSTALREVIYLQNLLKELKKHGLKIPTTQPTVRCKVFEDNTACIKVTKEAKLQPQTKHLSVRLFHFRKHVRNKNIDIVYCPTDEQLADILQNRYPFANLSIYKN